MELYIAGGCSEHGRNSFLVSSKKCCFLVDAGLMKEKPDEPFPILSDEQIKSIDYLFLTHCHADHAGAIPWLYDKGFRGKIVASRETFNYLPCSVKETVVLEECGKPLREFRLGDDLWVQWGRSGHCIGSVWYLFRIKDRRILFTGDYEERSYAYKCDKIRNVYADLAVIDCAYGYEKDGADAHRKDIERAVDRVKSEKIPSIFPVPAHGRGFDVLRLLAERGIPVVLSKIQVQEYRMLDDRRLWLKRGFLDAVKDLISYDIDDFEKTSDVSDVINEPYQNAGILVRDSQLAKQVNRDSAERVLRSGGCVILTGKQDPSGFARKFLNEERAEFYRISVHQNVDEMLRLARRNSFRTVIPFHCREKLTFRKTTIKVLRPGDRIRF